MKFKILGLFSIVFFTSCYTAQEYAQRQQDRLARAEKKEEERIKKHTVPTAPSTPLKKVENTAEPKPAPKIYYNE